MIKGTYVLFEKHLPQDIQFGIDGSYIITTDGSICFYDGYKLLFKDLKDLKIEFEKNWLDGLLIKFVLNEKIVKKLKFKSHLEFLPFFEKLIELSQGHYENLLRLENDRIDFQNKIEQERIQIENERIKKLEGLKTSIISQLDKDNNGEVDLIDGESFNKLLNKHQKSITEIDKNYIQKFVKISLYLKTKKKNTQLIFDSIRETRNEKELDELMSLLKNQIHTYELLVFHSISMITSLVESDLITFYEIYESFDQLGVFNSNWENEVSNKLSDIGDGIKDLMYSINKMEYNIVNSLETLNYTTQESFSELNSSISSQLSSIDSSINFNNLLTGIQTYQMYKINQNTKRIN